MRSPAEVQEPAGVEEPTRRCIIEVLLVSGCHTMSRQDRPLEPLPACVTEYIDQVIRRMRYSRRVRLEVRQELLDHCTDALADCSDPRERQAHAEELIAGFGDAKLLATLLGRAKKRNRPPLLKALLRTGQACLLLLLLFVLYTAWFVTGQPTISTNYVTVLSDRLQPKAPESDNAWPLYRQAIWQFVLQPPMPASGTTQPSSQAAGTANPWPDMDVDLARMPDYMQVAHGKWIEQNEPAWQEYVAAGRRPYCWFSYGNTEDVARDLFHLPLATQPSASGPDEWIWKNSMLSVLLPHLTPLRQLSRIGIWKSRLDCARGDARRAIEDVLAVARVARHWQNPNRIIIEQLIAVRICDLACEEMRRLATDKGLTAADLQRAQEQLDVLYKDGYPTLGIESERLMLIDTIQRVFTEGGLGGGHPIPRLSLAIWHDNAPVRGAGPNLFMSMGTTAYWTAASLVHAGRDQTLAMSNAFYDQMAEWSSLTPYQRKDRPFPEDMVKKLSEPRYWILRMFLPNLSRAADLCYRARAEYEATLTVLALQRYRLDKGQYPPTLETLLQAGYLRQVPTDPCSAGLLVYRTSGEAFTLYSVGGDFHDDGGVQNPDDPWNSVQANSANQLWNSGPTAPATQPKPGDRLFWPVPALKPFPTEADPPGR